MHGVETSADAFDEFEAAGWEQRAAGYERFFVPITSRVIPSLLDAARVRSGVRVLDLGSGPGHVAAACATRGASVVGLDIAHEMVALARARHPELTFRQGDAQQLPFEEGSMDAVVGNFAVLHVGRPERVAAESARVLAPGGRLSLTTWDAPERARLIGVVTDAIAAVGAFPSARIPVGPPFFRFADETEFARLLEDAGLADVQVQTFAFRHRLASADDLWTGLLGGAVRTRALLFDQSEEVQSRIRMEFDRLAGEYVSADGLDIPVSVRIASGGRH